MKRSTGMTRIIVLLALILSMCVSCATAKLLDPDYVTTHKYDYNTNPDKAEKQYYWDSEYCGKWAQQKAYTGRFFGTVGGYDMDKFEKTYCECMEAKGWRKKK